MSNQSPNYLSSPQHQVSQIKHLAYLTQTSIHLHALVPSWQKCAHYNCKARSTNPPLPRKTNPIPKTPKSPQSLLHQGFTPILRPAPVEKTNPNKPNFNFAQTAGLAQIPPLFPCTSPPFSATYAYPNPQFKES